MFNEYVIHSALKLLEDTQDLGYEIDAYDPAYDIRDNQGLDIEFHNPKTNDTIDVMIDVDFTTDQVCFGIIHERGLWEDYISMIRGMCSYRYMLEHLYNYAPNVSRCKVVDVKKFKTNLERC